MALGHGAGPRREFLRGVPSLLAPRHPRAEGVRGPGLHLGGGERHRRGPRGLFPRRRAGLRVPALQAGRERGLPRVHGPPERAVEGSGQRPAPAQEACESLSGPRAGGPGGALLCGTSGARVRAVLGGWRASTQTLGTPRKESSLPRDSFLCAACCRGTQNCHVREGCQGVPGRWRCDFSMPSVFSTTRTHLLLVRKRERFLVCAPSSPGPRGPPASPPV